MLFSLYVADGKLSDGKQKVKSNIFSHRNIFFDKHILPNGKDKNRKRKGREVLSFICFVKILIRKKCV